VEKLDMLADPNEIPYIHPIPDGVAAGILAPAGATASLVWAA